MIRTTLLQRKSISVSDFRCSAGPGDAPFAEQFHCHSVSYVRKGSFGCRSRGRSFELVAGSILVGHPGDEYVCSHDHVCGDECLSFFLGPELVEAIGGPGGGLAGRRSTAAARIDGARRACAGRSRWPQRHRPRRGRTIIRQPLCRGGVGTLARARAGQGPGSPPRGGNRALDRCEFAPGRSTWRAPPARSASAHSTSCACSQTCSASPRTNIWCARGCGMRHACWPMTASPSPTSPTKSGSAISPISSARSTARPESRRAGFREASRGKRKIFQERLALH